MGLLSPPKSAIQQVKRVFVRRHACDRCGFSQDGSIISTAWYKIVTKKNGPLYLCRHHYLEHSHYCLVADYPVHLEEVDSSV